jgi:hypothetical protein
MKPSLIYYEELKGYAAKVKRKNTSGLLKHFCFRTLEIIIKPATEERRN